MFQGLLFLVLLGALCAGSAFAASTGYRDDFSGEKRGWADSTSFKVSQEGGVLTLVSAKTTMWAGEYLYLGAVDLSANPVVNLKIRADKPCVLHVYLCDAADKNILLPRSVRVTTGFLDYCWDFSGMGGIDLKNIKGLIFTPNGAANSWDGGALHFRDLRIGDQAKKFASLEGLPDLTLYQGTKRDILLIGLEHAGALSLTGAEKGLEAKFSAVNNGQTVMSLSCLPGASGVFPVTLTAAGEGGYGPNNFAFTITIEDNLPPTVAPPAPLTAQAGAPQKVKLTGISDGNRAAEQPITFSCSSSDNAVVNGAEVSIHYAPGSPYAEITFTAKKPGTAILALTLDDKAGGKSSTRIALAVKAVKNWNNPPAFDAVPDQIVFTGGEQRVALTGIANPGGGPVSFSAATSDPAVIADPRVEYKDGQAALLFKTTEKEGSAVITVTAADKDGTADNNGDLQASREVKITTRALPRDRYTEKFDNWDTVKPRLKAETGITVTREKDGDTPIMKIACREKSTFGGLWLDTPPLDLSKAPYLTVDVKSDQGIMFNMYFWDGNKRRNDGAARSMRLNPGGWQTVTFDFSGPRQMETGEGKPMDATWVTQVLFNFHPAFTWPFSNYTGNLYLRNLRIGADANIPSKRDACALDDIPAQLCPRGAGKQQIILTGIGSTNGAPVTVTARANDAGALPDVSVEMLKDGQARLSYTVGEREGKFRVDVSAEAAGADRRATGFDVYVMNPKPDAGVNIDAAKKFQTIRGFGTAFNDLPAELYAGHLGASAIRLPTVDETPMEKDDGLGPDVLDRSALNYNAFNLAHLRELKEAGVETFIYTSWTPPAWMKKNLSTNYQQAGFDGNCDNTANRLDYFRYGDFAKLMVGAVRMLQEEAGITPAGIGLQNEPSFHEPYGSAILDPGRFVELIKVVGRRFDKEGISVPLYMPEQVFTQGNMMEFIDRLNADAEAQKYCTVVATHSYDNRGVGAAQPEQSAWGAMWQRAQRGAGPKELWMTETDTKASDWASALDCAYSLYGALEYGNIGLWTYWGIDGQLVDRGKPLPSFYAVRQFWKYIRPGAVRLASESGSGDILTSAYLNDEAHGGKLVCVIINRGNTARAVSLNVQGRSTPKAWQVISSDAIRRGAESGLPAGGTLLLPPQSVVTVVEK